MFFFLECKNAEGFLRGVGLGVRLVEADRQRQHGLYSRDSPQG